MGKPPKEGKLIYHLTSLDNLESIFQNGLLPRCDLEDFDDVAEAEIIDHRELKGLNSYVPFHFFCGNPFDGAVQLTHSDKDFVFITLHRDFAKDNDFVILTQHPLSIPDSDLLSYEEGIDEIDWETMAIRDYADRDCREICMAECLSPNAVDATDFYMIFTPNEVVNKTVIKLRDKYVGKNAFKVVVNELMFIQ